MEDDEFRSRLGSDRSRHREQRSAAHFVAMSVNDACLRNTEDNSNAGAAAVQNPYLMLESDALAGVWGMRAAELMPPAHDIDEQASVSRDTAFMLLAGAMQVARAEIQATFTYSVVDQNEDERERRVRFEVLKRAALLAIPEHPELWLLDAHAKGLLDIRSALDSDEGLCQVLRHLQQIAWIGGRWHTSKTSRE